MPELPEVESVRRSLEPVLIGRRVVGVAVHRRDVITTDRDPAGGYARNSAKRPARLPRVSREELLDGARFTSIERRGKVLAIVGRAAKAGERSLVVHLGMTGQVRWIAPGGTLGDEKARAHVHVTWRLDDGSRVVFRDPRRFGGVWTVGDAADREMRVWSRLGPDALTVTAEELDAALHGRAARGEAGIVGRAVKAVLLDQSRVAGVGNIYADEALFRAGIAPGLRVGSSRRLGAERVAGLAEAVRGVLAAAVDAGGSTLRDYTDGNGRPGRAQLAHLVYGRGGEACTTCGSVLRSGVVAQRTTVWCPRCQGKGPG